MYLTKEDIQRIRDMPIVDELNLPRGRRVMIPCPMEDHRDKTASFIINPDNSYHCFGCGVHGYGLIDFYTDIQIHSGSAANKKEAFKKIIEEYGNI